MREWTMAILWAAVTAGALVLLDPDGASVSSFLGDTAKLAAPMWLAVQLEERSGGCLLKGIWS